MSRKPRRPTIRGVRPEGRPRAKTCHWCFDMPHRRVLGPWRDPVTKETKIGCPGCGRSYRDEEDEETMSANLQEAAWELLEDQRAREVFGVSTFEEALRAVEGVDEHPDPGAQGRFAKYCNVCFGLAHRRRPDGCPQCKGEFGPEMLPVHTGLQSTMFGIPELDSIA